MPSIDDLHLADRLMSQGVLNEGQLLECFRILREGGAATLAGLLAERGVLGEGGGPEETRTIFGIAPPQADPCVRSERVFGRYLLLQALGQGGFGVVHRAYDSVLGRQVALKQMIGRDGVLMERFQQEARAAARLSHPGIVPVHDVGVMEGVPYYTMELVQGRTLLALLRGDCLSRREAVSAVRDVARAAHAAHEAGIVHRDLKPGNVLVTLEETRPPGAAGRIQTVRVTDFGLAKDVAGSDLTVTGQVLGTPAYMSPEQASGAGHRVDRRADVYSLGAMLYDALAGVPPFVADDPFHLLYRICSEEAPPPRRIRKDIPLDLQTITLKALEKDPNRRYPTAEDFAAELDRWLSGVPVIARPLSRTGRVVRWVRRNRLVSAAIVLGLLAVANPVVISIHARVTRRAEASRLRQEGLTQLEQARTLLQALPPAPEIRAADEVAIRLAERTLSERLRSVQDAAETLARALALDPSDDRAREGLAEAYFTLYDRAIARASAEEAATYERLVRITASEETYRRKYEPRLRRRGRVRFRVLPTDATTALFRFRETDDSRLEAVPWPLAEEQEEGSYVLRVDVADGPAVVRPFRVRAGTETEVAVEAPAKVPDGFAYIPGGEYPLPSDLTATEGLPSRSVNLAPFFLARFEITFEEYSLYADSIRAKDEAAGNAALKGIINLRPGPRTDWLTSPRSPVCGVSVEQVRAYLAWRSIRDGRTYRLPTEDEWEVAARGADGRRYPWGEYFRPGFCCNRHTVLTEDSKPLGIGWVQADESPFGIRDLAGSASEWTGTPFRDFEGWFIVKGGSWGWDSLYARCASRIEAVGVAHDPHIGFRMASDLP